MPASRWFSADPGKAWAEKFFLLYSPIWMALVGWALLSGAVRSWDDATYMGFGLVCGLPPVLVPALMHRRVPALAATPWYRSYWFKYNVWIFLFVFVGTYFLTHYFFDVLGMNYGFPTRWNLGAALVGRSRQEIPAFMYPLTQAYFVTYHVAMLVVLRRLRNALGVPPPGARGAASVTPLPARIALAVVTLALAYAVAFGETWFMAIDALRGYFSYTDKPRMLLYGSLFYSCYFLVSLPLLARLDEPPSPPATLGRAALDSLAAGMLVFFLLDALAWIAGPIV